jgi:hypothetical protein
MGVAHLRDDFDKLPRAFGNARVVPLSHDPHNIYVSQKFGEANTVLVIFAVNSIALRSLLN